MNTTTYLLRVSDGKLVTAVFKETRISKKEKNWLFDWSRPSRYGFIVLNLIADKRIQGRVALKPNADWNAYEIDIAETALRNRGHRDGTGKAYQGVGTALFAEVVRRSLSDGFGGYVTFVAKTELMQYYYDTLGALHIGNGRMVIDSTAAKKLLTEKTWRLDNNEL